MKNPKFNEVLTEVDQTSFDIIYRAGFDDGANTDYKEAVTELEPYLR